MVSVKSIVIRILIVFRQPVNLQKLYLVLLQFVVKIPKVVYLLNYKVMNELNFRFCSGVAAYIHTFSQFPLDVCNWIACQFALESSFGDSSLARSNNNYCGMKNPLVRISSAIHAGDPVYYWAQYCDLFSCVVDYLLCVQYHRPLSCDYDTIEHFSRFISDFYCPDKDYIDKVNRIYSQFNLFQNGKN